MRARGIAAAALLAAVAALFAPAAGPAAGIQRHARPRHPQRARKQSKRRKHGRAIKDTSATSTMKEIESILQLPGSVGGGDLVFDLDRSDIGDVTLHGTPIKPPFAINGDFDFQPVGNGEYFMNGDFPVKSSEIDPVVERIVNSGLVLQAEHQHMYDFEPIVWFIHLRGRGTATKIAGSLRYVLAATSTPLPQEAPAHPSTPLDVGKLKQILGAYEASVGEEGIVTFFVAERKPVTIEGVKVKPATNIATNISFEPLDKKGTEVAVIADFVMESAQVDPLMRVMRAQGWDIGCLYNQETDEHPQLFFSHQFKTGEPTKLAEEIATGLNQADAK